ncbi:MAG: DUF4349 domain-containing protein [Leptospira sp.]|nr:DUF4349 domain-containing protein [Leptospira sp.]
MNDLSSQIKIQKQSLFLKTISLLIIYLFLSFCSQSESPKEDSLSETRGAGDMEFEMMSEEAPPQSPASKRAKPGQLKAPSDSSEKKLPSNSNFKIEFSPLNPDIDRLLEYTVKLEFESSDFSETRTKLYKFAGEFGFLQSSYDTFHKGKSLHATIWVKKDKLYEFLLVADELGKLRSEEINTVDLTYDNFQKEIELQRESIRGNRRAKALSATDTKTYAERERLLSESEEKEDEAKKEKWQIQDRVTWAKVNIQIIDPKLENQIAIPDFTSIFYDFASALLYILYIGIYLVPFGLLGWLLWRKTNLFTRKKTD